MYIKLKQTIVQNTNVHTLVTKRRRRNLNIKERQVKEQAQRAVEFASVSAKTNRRNRCRRKPNAYGIAFKYIFALRDMTFKDVSRKTNYSPQSINYIVNRMSVDRFDCVFVQKMCDFLNLDYYYFRDMVEEIKILMEKK
jgi:hypothetical protein